MSTTFDVYPGIKYIPSFNLLLSNAEKQINKFLKDIGVKKTIRFNAEIMAIEDNQRKPFQLTDKMVWDSSMYVWFYLNNIPGGTDVYFYQHRDLDIAFLMEELQVNPNFRKYQRIIEHNLHLGYSWSFRRSAGQPGIINLSYGFLAASLAKLTEGLLYSDDGAWDYKKFPADPDDFMQWYFRLEYMDEQSDVDFYYVKESLESIRKALML